MLFFSGDLQRPSRARRGMPSRAESLIAHRGQLCCISQDVRISGSTSVEAPKVEELAVLREWGFRLEMANGGRWLFMYSAALALRRVHGRHGRHGRRA